MFMQGTESHAQDVYFSADSSYEFMMNHAQFAEQRQQATSAAHFHQIVLKSRKRKIHQLEISPKICKLEDRFKEDLAKNYNKKRKGKMDEIEKLNINKCLE